MSITRASVRLVFWLSRVEDGALVFHAHDRSSFVSLCGEPAFEVELEDDGKLKCIACKRLLYRPKPPIPPRPAVEVPRRRAEDPNR